jgi:DNA recombination protein RmuC
MSAMLLAPSDMLGLAVGLGSVIIVLLVWQGLVARDRLQRLRLLAEQGLAGQRSEAETLRATLAATERALVAAQAQVGGQLRVEVATALEQMRTAMDGRLTEIRASVNEQLHVAVEKQMTTSFARVTEQFAAVQKAMGDVQAVTAQIGDIKRLFGNVKTRGGWGETQLRAMLDDILPAGAYETNWKPRAGSDDVVEFAVIMPMHGEAKMRLPIDAKFPVEDYERMLNASEAGDVEGERAARRALERRIRDEAKKIAQKYISPPDTVEFAVLYLPTDGLYAEVARIAGLIDEIGRMHRVVLLGPSLFPALLRTIHLGHITMSLERKAEEIGRLLGATKLEMGKMDAVFDKLAQQADRFSTTIHQARTRTRAVGRVLRSVENADPETAAALLGATDEPDEVDQAASE